MEQRYERVLKDSGDRTEFASGAVRDIQENKGRCDLLPLDVVMKFIEPSAYGEIIDMIAVFQETGDTSFLYLAVTKFSNLCYEDEDTMLLEVAKHFEEGAKKYGEWNWQKGIPVWCYLSSGVRHLLKWLRGDDDEPHDRAFCWNMICAIWTCKHKPELNGYKKDGEKDD